MLLVGVGAVGGYLALRDSVAEDQLPITQTESYGNAAPFLERYCLSCHGDRQDAEGGVWLGSLLQDPSMTDRRLLWRKVAREVSRGSMPPESAPQPGANERQQFAAALQNTLGGHCGQAAAGQVTMRRLNRTEYNNTIRDLFGVDYQAATDFPSDDVGYGFDNIGDVLSLSPLHLEKYLHAAEQIAERAIIVVKPGRVRFETDALRPEGGAERSGDAGIAMYSESSASAPFKSPYGGKVQLKLLAWAQQAGPEVAKLNVSVGGRSFGEVEVRGTLDAPSLIELPADMTAGEQSIQVTFINDYYEPDHPDPNNRDRNAYLQFVEVVGPLERNAALPGSHHQILFSQPDGTNFEAVATRVIAAFARRAFRRPATGDEISRLVNIAASAHTNGESFERSVQLAVIAILVSPHFLFLVEPDDPGATRDLTDWEIASRLSYFLWSSTPDEELMRLAEGGQLRSKATLIAQTHRMLADPRSRALADNFAGQWLQLNKLEGLDKSKAAFPEFTPELRSAMATETKLFFLDAIREDRSITTFLNANDTYINGDLASLYGIDGVNGSEFRKVAIPNRNGLLGHASFLTVTSNPTRTSPVKRGKYILDNLLGDAPPPPPPSVDSLNENDHATAGLTMKQRLAQHRKDPACNSCHARMDPIGLALENFNGIGRWRTQDDTGVPVDPFSTLPDGASLQGASDLREYLMSKTADFSHAFAEKLLTYALGRGMSAGDQCHIDSITRYVQQRDLRIRAYIEAVVTSEAFLKRGDPSMTWSS